MNFIIYTLYTLCLLFYPLLSEEIQSASTPYTSESTLPLSDFLCEISPKIRILVGCPVHQKPKILQEFTNSLLRLNRENYTLDYFFVDDNILEESSTILETFNPPSPEKVFISKGRDIYSDPGNNDTYRCTEKTHEWTAHLMKKVAAFKDRMIEHALDHNYDYLFLIDSDIVMNPKTIAQLLKAKKEIVSNIYWTKWEASSMELPQVWLKDQYSLYQFEAGDPPLDELEKQKRTHEFLIMLRKPGVYEVGGLGACTLISKKALGKGINFKKIKNISLFGEDRDFCVRAAALGIELHVDTHYPAFHIYRESELQRLPEYIHKSMKDCLNPNAAHLPPPPYRLTLSMIVRNEADRYLRRVLLSAREYITDAVIIDDASTDSTVEVCQEVLKGIPLKIIRNNESKFANEIDLRKQQWEETIKTNPEWIINLDADEIFEPRIKYSLPNLLTNKTVDLYFFHLFDMWDENHYREDTYWYAHRSYKPFILLYKPEINYCWKETSQHCGRFPLSVNNFQCGFISDIRLKHYGWSTIEDRKAKYNRYKSLDSDSTYGLKEQYESILDVNPRLIEWKE